MLKTSDGPENNGSSGGSDGGGVLNSTSAKDFPASMQDLSTLGMSDPADLSNLDHPQVNRMNAFANSGHGQAIPDPPAAPFGVRDGSTSFDDSFSFEMISLGLEEPLPTQDVIDELWVVPKTYLVQY